MPLSQFMEKFRQECLGCQADLLDFVLTGIVEGEEAADEAFPHVVKHMRECSLCRSDFRDLFAELVCDEELVELLLAEDDSDEFESGA